MSGKKMQRFPSAAIADPNVDFLSPEKSATAGKWSRDHVSKPPECAVGLPRVI
jgi:hypothetical protein